jgi:chemotaxis protein MotA
MKSLDFTVLFGLLLGILVIGIGAAFDGVRPKFLWQPAAFLIVVGGTLAAVILRRGFHGLITALKTLAGLLLKEKTDEHTATLARLAWLAQSEKKQGARVFENYADSSDDMLIKRGLYLCAEYAEVEDVRRSLDEQLYKENEFGLRDVGTLEAAGGFAPTFGILGAVLGLISVLRLLDKPEALGLGIATAFVATIYGIALSNLFLFPLASRMKDRHDAAMSRRQEIAEAIIALASHESPLSLARRYNLKRVSDEAKIRLG